MNIGSSISAPSSVVIEANAQEGLSNVLITPPSNTTIGYDDWQVIVELDDGYGVVGGL